MTSTTVVAHSTTTLNSKSDTTSTTTTTTTIAKVVPVKSALSRWKLKIQSIKRNLPSDYQQWAAGNTDSTELLLDLRTLENSGCPSDAISNQIADLESAISNQGSDQPDITQLGVLNSLYNQLFGNL